MEGGACLHLFGITRCGGVGWLHLALLVLDYILRVHGSFVSRRNVSFLMFGGVEVLAARVCPPPPLSILRRPRPKWWSALVLPNAVSVVEKKSLANESYVVRGFGLSFYVLHYLLRVHDVAVLCLVGT